MDRDILDLLLLKNVFEIFDTWEEKAFRVIDKRSRFKVLVSLDITVKFDFDSYLCKKFYSALLYYIII